MAAESKSKSGGAAAKDHDYPNIIEEPIRVIGDRTRQSGKSKKQSGKGSRKTGKKKAGKK
jgi:hypothetical protein